MEAKDLLVGVLTKTLNKTDEEVSELLYTKSDDSDELTLNEDALTLVLDHDAQRVANIKKSVKPDDKALKDQYLKGIKDGKAELEAELKTVANIESESIGSDLVKEVVNAISECNLPTDDQIKTHPLYLDLEKGSVKKDVHEQVVSEFNDFKLNQERNSKLQTIRKDAITVRNNLNPILSQIPEIAQTRQEDYLAKFAGYDYELDNDGNHVIINDGKRLEDKHGNPMKFSDFAASIASKHYEFQVSDDLGQSGNQNQPGGNGKGGKIDVPKTEAEYLRMMSECKTGEERIALQAAWKASQNK